MAKVMKVWLSLGAVLVLAVVQTHAKPQLVSNYKEPGKFVFSKAELNCKSIPLKPSFEAIMDSSSSCGRIKENAKDAYGSLDPLTRAGMIEDCMCNLLSRKAAYESLVTPSVVRAFDQVWSIVGTQPASEGEFLTDMESKTSALKQLKSVYPFPGRGLVPLDQLCSDVHQAIVLVWDIFEAASKLSGNPGYGKMMTKYDSNLFVLVTVFKACKALN